MGDKLVGETPQSKSNALICIEYILLKRIGTSAAEAETVAFFHTYKTAIGIKKMIQGLEHQESTIPIKTEIITAARYRNLTLKEKCGKTWDIIWYFLQYKLSMKEFVICLDKGTNIKADFHTKHFPSSCHTTIFPTYILKEYHLYSINTRERMC